MQNKDKSQLQRFFSPQIRQAELSRTNATSLCFVGFNGMGKNILANFLADRDEVVLISCKDTHFATTEQFFALFAQALSKKLGPKVIEQTSNSYNLYHDLLSFLQQQRADFRLQLIFLDLQNILSLDANIFDLLLYLHHYASGKLSLVFLSEPQCLWSENAGWQRLVEANFKQKFHFLSLFPPRVMREDVLIYLDKYPEFQRKLLDSLVEYAGGIHGMMKALLRYSAETQVKTMHSASQVMLGKQLYQFWIDEILQSLSPSMRAELYRAVVLKQSQMESVDFQTLLNLCLIDESGQLLHPLMERQTKQLQSSILPSKQVNKLILQGKFLHYNLQQVHLSSRERQVWRLLYSKAGQLLSYDELADLCFADEPETFSLWTLSQIITRLRKKLHSIGISPKIIETKRGLGYMWREEKHV